LFKLSETKGFLEMDDQKKAGRKKTGLRALDLIHGMFRQRSLLGGGGEGRKKN